MHPRELVPDGELWVSNVNGTCVLDGTLDALVSSWRLAPPAPDAPATATSPNDMGGSNAIFEFDMRVDLTDPAAVSGADTGQRINQELPLDHDCSVTRSGRTCGILFSDQHGGVQHQF